MITPSPHSLQPADWQQALAKAISDPQVLLEALNLPTSLLDTCVDGHPEFALRVTSHYLSLIEPGNPDDPLLRQVLPLAVENAQVTGFDTDPVNDGQATQGAGVLHKYTGRALLITTGACAIHCRYCFRRHYPYAEDNALRHWDAMLSRLRADTSLHEAILSGGDPLTLSDSRLAELITQLEKIPHLQRLRIHSRVPVVLPSRITDALADILSKTRLHTSLVLHCNHPAELAKPLDTHLQKLRRAGVTLLNQAVLLKGVNDELDTLENLSIRLFEFGILPYYINLLDRVAGAAHFNVPLQQARVLETGLRGRLPGYLMPRWVRDIPEQASKTPINAL